MFVKWPIKLAHEAIARDRERFPGKYDISQVDPDDYRVPQFLDHPLTVQYGPTEVLPCGLYTDKVRLGPDLILS